MTGKYDIQIFWSTEDEAYVAAAPDFEGSVSAHGSTPEDALRELEVAIGLVEDVYAEEGWELPAAHGHSGRLVLRMPRSLHERLSRIAKGEGVSLNTLIVSYLSERIDDGSIVERLRGLTRKDTSLEESHMLHRKKHGS